MKRSLQVMGAKAIGGWPRSGVRGSAVYAVALAVCAALLPCASPAATPGYTETWATEWSLSGWAVEGTKATISNPEGYVDLAFKVISGPPMPDSVYLYAGGAASGGAFTGNYEVAGIGAVGFKFVTRSEQPSALWLCFRNGATGRAWYRPLEVPAAGTIRTNMVDMGYSAGWTGGTAGTEQEFLADKRNVTWLGLYIRRSAGTAIEHYCIDNFTLVAAPPPDLDSDGDGMTDVKENQSGTNPFDPSSVLRMQIQASGSGSGIMLRWASESNRIYSVFSSTNVLAPFSPLAAGLPATPPENTYDDTTATGLGPYFYRIGVEP